MANNKKWPLLLKIAELYYLEGNSQNEIAKIVGLSRPTVSRALEEAKEEGIVKITVEAPFQKANVLPAVLKKKFNLSEVIIIKGIGDYEYDVINLGRASANYISQLLEPDTKIGISWGRAVEELIAAMPSFNFDQSKAILLNGSIGQMGPRKDGSELIYELGRKLGGESVFFNAPAFVDSSELQTLLLKQPQIQETLEIGKKVDISFGGIGDLTELNNTLVASSLFDTQDLSALKKAGAVGTIMATPFDQHGDPVYFKRKFPISIALNDLKKINIRIGAALSENRKEAVLAAIQGKLINTLICDESLANALLSNN